jgi:hypothetical protein
MLPAGGTKLIGREQDKNVGEMKLHKLNKKGKGTEIDKKNGEKNWNK